MNQPFIILKGVKCVVDDGWRSLVHAVHLFTQRDRLQMYFTRRGRGQFGVQGCGMGTQMTLGSRHTKK
jgi:hypothetical protein